MSRRERYERQGYEPAMPPLSVPYLFDRLMEIGPVEQGGMDRMPLRLVTIKEWADAMGVSLDPWEMRLLRRLSAAWLDESRKATNPAAAPPWASQDVSNRTMVARQVAAMFGL